jgi:hypothetical protein
MKHSMVRKARPTCINHIRLPTDASCPNSYDWGLPASPSEADWPHGSLRVQTCGVGWAISIGVLKAESAVAETLPEFRSVISLSVPALGGRLLGRPCGGGTRTRSTAFSLKVTSDTLAVVSGYDSTIHYPRSVRLSRRPCCPFDRIGANSYPSSHRI